MQRGDAIYRTGQQPYRVATRAPTQTVYRQYEHHSNEPRRKTVVKDIAVLTAASVVSGIVLLILVFIGRAIYERLRRKQALQRGEADLFDAQQFPNVVHLSTSSELSVLAQPFSRPATRDEIAAGLAITPTEDNFEDAELRRARVPVNLLKQPVMRYFIFPNVYAQKDQQHLLSAVASESSKHQLLRKLATGKYPFLVEIYARWCRTCQLTQPEVNEFAKKHTNVPTLVIDGSKLSIAQELVVRSYPTLLLYSPKSKSFREVNDVSEMDEEIDEWLKAV